MNNMTTKNGYIVRKNHLEGDAICLNCKSCYVVNGLFLCGRNSGSVSLIGCCSKFEPIDVSTMIDRINSLDGKWNEDN